MSELSSRSIKQNLTFTASRIGRCILRDGLLGNWHTDGVFTAAPANACWRSWASIASFQASSMIEYLPLDTIGQGVIVNTIASMNLFATSKVACRYWGIMWSALILGCETFWSPLDLCRGSTRVDGAWSDSENWLRRVDFWHLSSGGAIASAGFRECGSGGHAMTVSARLHFFGSETHGVCKDLSRHAWHRSWSCCCWSKLSSSMWDDKVDSLEWSLWSSPICWSVLLSYFNNEIGDIS